MIPDPRHEPEQVASGADKQAADQLLAVLPARSHRREVWVGLFVILGGLAVLIALFTLTDAATFRGRYVLTTRVEDAGGIRRGDPVQMRGVNIGRVQKFVIAPEGVEVRLEIEGEYDIPTDSRVRLVSNGLLGGMTAEILPGRSSEEARSGDVLSGAVVPDALDVAGNIGVRADQVLGQVQRLLDDRTVGALGQGAIELHALLRELSTLAAAERDDIRGLTQSLRRSSERLDRATSAPELERALAHLDSIARGADRTVRSTAGAAAALESFMTRIDRGEGTLGRLSRDDQLYESLTLAVENVSRLAEDMRRDPRRYINLRVF